MIGWFLTAAIVLVAFGGLMAAVDSAATGWANISKRTNHFIMPALPSA